MRVMKGEEIRKVWTASAVRLAVLAPVLSCVSPVVSVFTGMAGVADSRALDQGPYSEVHTRQQATARVVLRIEGMDCPVCAAGLQNNLRQIPGVRRAEVRFQDKQADLDCDPKAVEPARLAQVVAEAGFKVSGILPANN